MQKLNEAQQKAIETTEGPVLIIAGAGTGKTGVITHRILNLIKKGVSPKAILAVTFTNKAAKEMRERVDSLISENLNLNRPVSSMERPFISTFHSLGVHIIREQAGRLNLTKNFSIYDRSDSRRIIKDSMEQASIDPKKIDPGLIINLISKAKGKGLSHLEYKDRARSYIEDITAELWEKYEATLNREKALDFDDLLVKTARLLRNDPNLRKHYGSIWQYIHIDEYQDTNEVQYEIARYLAESHRNICVVGDVDQNIYSWRGATIENILNFEKDYPETTVIALEKNYRSTKTILAAANGVIEKNRRRKKKNLYTENDQGEKISLLVSYSEIDEARTIAETAKNLIAQGIPAQEIAVLYRTNFQSRILEEFFIKKNIPYQLAGIKFFERKEVKDVLSYVKGALNRQSWSDLGRIINVPPRGIGKASVAKIMSGKEDLLPEGMRLKLANFYKLLDDINLELKTKKPSEVVRFVIQESGLEKLLRSGSAEDEERLLNVQELATVASQYDSQAPEEGISNFLTNAALASDQDDLSEERQAVKLMTVHASKGLEFDHVFIAGLEQDLFPFKHIDDDEKSEADQEEERRLFYVAITRAKKKLYLSHAIVRTIYGAQKVAAPSEFIDDIEKELLEEQAPEKPSGAKAIFIDF